MSGLPPSKRPSEPTIPARRTLNALLSTTRRTMLTVGGLTVIVVALVWLIISVGILIVHDRQDRRGERRRQAAGAQVITDVYRALNDINGQLAALRNQPPPAPITPPTTSGRPTTTVQNRPATTRSSRSQPSAVSTTTTAAPRPTSTTTGTTRPPSSTTTTTACFVAVRGECLPPKGPS